ncbi:MULTISPECIES: DUF2971 domain-containing protein [unclassified Serratia (in: enterobacteria)]|uniref:DUF2971 domain-containing protein n=1 Tax=unclassified Serratia (in: enterobacteria) TaxID=2647522 RepID=UPI001CBCC4A4|nr:MULTISPECIES: DUF2971 domain-containing protein [unclassified Serratia (in: enterobacteria)]UAN51657.1 DUF2971 domain-containing protein [Serratia sp. JSRIV002]UAN57662.1 DUF2971 domain-containing protein [Serratia sp. JSRIV004]
MLYKYVGHENIEQVIEYLKCFIEKGTMFASKPVYFNDPAEFKVIFNFDAEPDIIKGKYFSDNPNHLDTDFKKWNDSFDDHAKWHVGYSTREAYLTQNGTICLTRDNNNYLMWSHYAHSHTGFCIGFDDSIVNCIDDCAVFGDVNYTNSIPKFNYFTEDLEKFASAIFLHKGLPWAYEKEFRIITDKWGVKKIDKSLIKEIVIGCRAPFQLQNFVSELIGTGIEVSKMGLSQDNYSLKKIPLEKNMFFQGDV